MVSALGVLPAPDVGLHGQPLGRRPGRPQVEGRLLPAGVALGQAASELGALDLEHGELAPQVDDVVLGGGQPGVGLVDRHVHREGVAALAERDRARAHEQGGAENGGSELEQGHEKTWFWSLTSAAKAR